MATELQLAIGSLRYDISCCKIPGLEDLTRQVTE
jgi:hypothetical protein